jgi:hypothetical protein
VIEYQIHGRVHVLKGENRGSTLDFYNIVKTMSNGGAYTGPQLSTTLPVLPPTAGCGVAVVLQHGRVGRVLGAAYLSGGTNPFAATYVMSDVVMKTPSLI